MSDHGAVHEVGHGLAAVELGYPLTGLELDGNGAGLTLTGCVGERLPVPEQVALLESFAPETRDRILRERLWVALAGPAADHLVRGLERWDGEQDRAPIHAYCMALEVPPWRVFPRVQALLRTSWPAVEALAAELHRLRRVEGPRAAEILTAHGVVAGAWLTEVDR